MCVLCIKVRKTKPNHKNLFRIPVHPGASFGVRSAFADALSKKEVVFIPTAQTTCSHGKRINMGCGTSQPALPTPATIDDNLQRVSSDEMAAVRKALADAQAKAAEDPNPIRKQKTFKRKFDGFKAGGGSKHDIVRAKDMSPEAVAERKIINAAIKAKREASRKKREDRERQLQQMPVFKRTFTQGADLVSEGARGATNLLVRMPTRGLARGAGALRRQVTRVGSASGSSSSGSLFRSFTMKKKSARGLSAANKPDFATANASDIHAHDNEESKTHSHESKSAGSKKHVGFSVTAEAPSVEETPRVSDLAA